MMINMHIHEMNTPRDEYAFYQQGVTYDTGGADIKAGGVMAGMHRDKCGAAAVAGFFKVPVQGYISD